MHLSEKLRTLCSRYDMTQERLAAELDISQPTVGRWLNGTTRPYERHLLRLAEIFGLEKDELLNDAVPLPPRVTDGRHLILKRAADAATLRFPKNQEAGQAFFEAEIQTQLWKTSTLDAASEIRKKAAELIMLAERMERSVGVEVLTPVHQKPPTDEQESARATLERLKHQARAELEQPSPTAESLPRKAR